MASLGSAFISDGIAASEALGDGRAARWLGAGDTGPVRGGTGVIGGGEAQGHSLGWAS